MDFCLWGDAKAKQTVFADKPTTLDDIKQNVAYYEKSWTKLWSPEGGVSQSSRSTHMGNENFEEYA